MAPDELDEAEVRARRLGELEAADGDEAVAPDALRGFDAGGPEHGGPVDAVEARDVLADDVQVRGPELPERIAVRIVDRGDVVRQRVEPHVHGVLLIPRKGDAPADAGAGGRDVLEPPLEEARDLVPPRPRAHGIGILAQPREQHVPVVGEPEEPVLLLRPLDLVRGVERAAPVRQLLLLLERLASGAVVALVRRAAEVAVRGDALHEHLDAAVMARLRRSDEVVVRQSETIPNLEEGGGDAINPGLRLRAVPFGRPLHLLAVFVHADEKVHVVAAGAAIARDDIGADLLDRVTDVRVAVGVVDRRRQVEIRHGQRSSSARRAVRLSSRSWARGIVRTSPSPP